MLTYLPAGRWASNAPYRSSRVRPSTATSTRDCDDPDEPMFGTVTTEPKFTVDEEVPGSTEIDPAEE